mmetsp:Transcript_30458/g.83999  ORF Transcript_30458/g.83999 Transcript_30458/m.83999 type:complete len:238 (-) Transcript_30458:224-937(-)
MRRSDTFSTASRSFLFSLRSSSTVCKMRCSWSRLLFASSSRRRRLVPQTSEAQSPKAASKPEGCLPPAPRCAESLDPSAARAAGAPAPPWAPGGGPSPLRGDAMESSGGSKTATVAFAASKSVIRKVLQVGGVITKKAAIAALVAWNFQPGGTQVLQEMHRSMNTSFRLGSAAHLAIVRSAETLGFSSKRKSYVSPKPPAAVSENNTSLMNKSVLFTSSCWMSLSRAVILTSSQGHS